ncbi:MAG: Asp-tRNA(Asn)/Glu-tRNA(Gln) amidotransferase subunit GatA [Peptococcaceae bacterium]|nr:Asp-tRNA(Asn)/Glu-tRNA(Gln) amidotransferase subunit GatA [Peptococcaceae bacterium]
MKSGADDLCRCPATVLARLIREKKVSPVEVVTAFLDRIDRVNPLINAYCTVAGEKALDSAREAERAVMSGAPAGPLHGVPVAVKDLTPTAGIRTTYGSKIFENHVPARDAVIVERVKKAGGIILGKTNTPEFGHKAVTDNILFGHTRNPWRLDRVAGGSSGGSAAAVAAGLAPLAEGSDGGGSVRIPAAACGVYGIKPTYGRIPMDAMAASFSSSSPFLHFGVITRKVADAALFLSVVAGPDSRDPFSLPHTGDDYLSAAGGDVKDLRIAFSRDLGYFAVHSGVREAVENAAGVFAGAGCRVEEADPGFSNPAETVLGVFNQLWCVHFAAFYRDYEEGWGRYMSPGVKAMIRAGAGLSAVDYKRLDLMRQQVWNKIEKVLARFDLIITPTLAVPAFEIGMPGPGEIEGRPVDPYSGWFLTYPFNLTGHPAASIPCGTAGDGLPVGLQIIGRRFDEATVLKASALFERIGPWGDRWPDLA